MNVRRWKIIWGGGAPGQGCLDACKFAKLEIERLAGHPSALHLRDGRAVVVALDDGAATASLQTGTETVLRDALAHGLAAFVSCSFNDATAVAVALENWRLDGIVLVTPRGEESELIEEIVRVREQPTINVSLQVIGGEPLSSEEEILLKRAFGDCSAVKLVKQSTGSAKVFCAFASLLNSRVGPIPLPFFVKFDDRKKIERELDNYRQCTTLHVPFNQRPNLDDERCLLSHSSGVIVGNFVEQSESLMEAIDRGAGRDALHSLFEGALRGWRRQPFYDTQYVVDMNILGHLRRSRPIAYNLGRKRRLEKRRHSAGPAVRPFEELDAMLAALPAIKYRYGTTHGDLHGNNVRIASSDAILIDFASVDYGPLTVDPAALDVSLMMDTKLIAGDDWVRLADEVYELKALRAPAVPPRPERDAANLLDALHYIRQTAFTVQFSDMEYPIVVALQLLRKASYDGDDAEGQRRRVHAYRLADRIIVQLADEHFRTAARRTPDAA
jgi:hypothetical protein